MWFLTHIVNMKDFALAFHFSNWVDFLTTSKNYNPSFSFELPPLHNKMISYTCIAPIWFIVILFLERATPYSTFSKLKNSNYSKKNNQFQRGSQKIRHKYLFKQDNQIF